MAIEALYVHIPFCEKRCFYCDFVTEAIGKHKNAHEQYRRYANAIAKELIAYHQADPATLRNVKTVYLGGGTPSVLGESLSIIFDALDKTLDVSQLTEFTVEANPESFDQSLINLLIDAKVTRVSLGVQSLSDQHLKRLGRIHNAAQAIRALTLAIDAGLLVSADLMCALPEQTTDELTADINALVSLGVGHISVYPLTIEPQTYFDTLVQRGVLKEPDDEMAAAHMLAAEDVLAAQGFERYEVANYSKRGEYAQHNSAYWKGVSYLGLGTGAASMFNPGDFPEVLLPALTQAAQAAGIFDETLAISTLANKRIRFANSSHGIDSSSIEFLSPRESDAEDLMLGMRCKTGIPQSQFLAFIERFASNRDEARAMQSSIDRLIERQLIETTSLDGAMRLTPTTLGWLCGNEIYGTMWDLRMPRSN